MIINCKQIADYIKAELPKGKEYYNKLIVIIPEEATKPQQMYLNGILKDSEEFGFEVKQVEGITHFQLKGYKLLDLGGILDSNFVFGAEYPIPCTAVAVIEVLDGINIDVRGKTVLVIGRGKASGKPIAKILLDRNATVIQAHSHTTQKQLEILTACADIVISCAGVPSLIKGHMVKPSHIIIDVGNDVDFENVADKVAYITPQKQGIGLVTRACLLRRLVK